MKKSSLAFYLIMPLFITIFCGAAIFLLSLQPYDRLKTYVRIGFMDNNVTIPESTGIAGLNIVQTDIDTDYSGEVTDSGEVEYPEYGTQYAVFEAGDMFVPVYWGGGAELLEMGACNTPSSVPAGAQGNTVISAHVNTYFHDLSQLNEGDTVMLYTNYGRFTYKVQKSIFFDSSNKSYIRKSDDNILTLYTCELDLLAGSSKRVGFVCSLESSEFYKQTEDTADEK